MLMPDKGILNFQFDSWEILQKAGSVTSFPAIHAESWGSPGSATAFSALSNLQLTNEWSELLKATDLHGISNALAVAASAVAATMDISQLTIPSVLNSFAKATHEICSVNKELAGVVPGLSELQKAMSDKTQSVESSLPNTSGFDRSAPEKNYESTHSVKSTSVKINSKNQISNVFLNTLNAIAALLTICQFFLGFLPDADLIVTKQALTEIIQQEKNQTELLKALLEKEQGLSELRLEVQTTHEQLQRIEYLLSDHMTNETDVFSEDIENALDESKKCVNPAPQSNQDRSLCKNE